MKARRRLIVQRAVPEMYTVIAAGQHARSLLRHELSRCHPASRQPKTTVVGRERSQSLPELGLILAMLCLALQPYAMAPRAPASLPTAPVRHDPHTATLIGDHAAAQVGVATAAVPVAAPARTARRKRPGARRAAHLCLPPRTPLPPPGPCGDRWRVPERPNPAGLLAAPPSVSAHGIWRALWAAGSPLADDGPRRAHETYAEYLWDRGAALGIDPAVVMAIFREESGYGTQGMAVLTHNLGNSRPDVGQQAVCGGDGCYGYEASWFDGIDGIYSLLRRYRGQGYTTLDQIIAVWAPPSDGNNDLAYLAGVHQTMETLYAAS